MGLSFSAFAQSQSNSGTEERNVDRTESERMQGSLAPAPTSEATRCSYIRDHVSRERCMDESRGASTGGSATPMTQQSGHSGPGATDKTHPGIAVQGFSASPLDVGTSSAGSGR